MAHKRMFTMDIVDSDAFLDMPTSAQNLYFHGNMRADDDGFISSIKRIMRMIGSSDDDLKILIAKRFFIPFETGVCVVKHWRMNNTIRKDRHKPTVYNEEMLMLEIKDNGAYTEGESYSMATIRQPNGNQLATKTKRKRKSSKTVENKGSKESGNQMATTGCRSIGEDRIGEDRTSDATDVAGDDESKKKHQQIVDVIDAFVVVNSANTRWYGNTTQRKAIEHLIKTHTFEQVMKVINLLPKSNTLPYFPQITTPHQLADKWDALSNAFIRKKNEHTEKSAKVIL